MEKWSENPDEGATEEEVLKRVTAAGGVNPMRLIFISQYCWPCFGEQP